MQKAIIIEDEARSRELLHDLVTANCPEVEVVAQSGTIDEAVALIRAHQPHLLFLDIELQTGTGFEILDRSRTSARRSYSRRRMTIMPSRPSSLARPTTYSNPSISRN